MDLSQNKLTLKEAVDLSQNKLTLEEAMDLSQNKLTLEEAMDLSQNKLRDGLTNRRLLPTSLRVFDYICLFAYVFVQGLFYSAVRGTP
jgi:hypothetical protein